VHGRGHHYVPWKDISGWKCIRCGQCCREYIVSLSYYEALILALKHNAPIIKMKNKYYLMPRADGSCPFLTKIGSVAYCRIYYERPTVCKLYPFYVSNRPVYGKASRAEIIKDGETYYVYVDKVCRGVNRSKNIEEVVRYYIELWKRYTKTT